MNILEIKKLNVNYKVKDEEIKAIEDLSINISKNSSYGIVGESGSGKSTLAMAILRLLPIEMTSISGSIKYRDKELLSISEDELESLRWKEISAVFQKSMNSLSPVHKVGNQMVDIYKVHGINRNKEEIRKKIIELLKIVNLPESIFDLYPHELSGGMMQRVSIALSLMFNPQILILDEATTALDVITESQILEEIKDIEKNFDLTRIMITHDISVVASSCEKVVIMYAGRLLEEGLVKDVFLNPLHPYTCGLLNSFPKLGGEKEQLKGIEGSLPDLREIIDGCIFYPRCEKRKNKCLRIRPLLKNIGRQRVSCHFPGGKYDG